MLSLWFKFSAALSWYFIKNAVLLHNIMLTGRSCSDLKQRTRVTFAVIRPWVLTCTSRASGPSSSIHRSVQPFKWLYRENNYVKEFVVTLLLRTLCNICFTFSRCWVLQSWTTWFTKKTSSPLTTILLRIGLRCRYKLLSNILRVRMYLLLTAF